MKKVIHDIRDTIGNTPLLKMRTFSTGKIGVFGKLEYFNPGGSVKDRVGIQMINKALQQGILQRGSTIIEATAGNTGLGIGMAALHEGFRVIFVVPDKFSVEKQSLMKALGAEVVNTPKALGMKGAIQRAKELQKEIHGAWIPDQFENEENVKAHRVTGKEIWEALDGEIDAVVMGAGSGGTLMGIGGYLKEQNPNIKIILSDPIGSIIGGGDPGAYHIEGIGNHFIPSIFNVNLVDHVEKVNEEQALKNIRLLAKEEGVLVGPSSGAALEAALRYRDVMEVKGNIVVIFPDRSDRYFSQFIYE